MRHPNSGPRNATAHRAARGVLAGLLGGVLLLPCVARAAMRTDPDWPCQSIKVAQLSLPSVWDGPPAEPYLTRWTDDPEVAALVRRVAPRRVTLEDAQAAIRAFATTLATSAQRRERLPAVMAGLFDVLDQERSQVLTGLDRFGRRQKQLAATIHIDMAKLRAQPQDGVTPLADQLGWEVRLFEQRRQSAAAVCNVPTVIEQRLFALARTVQQALD